MFEHVPPYAGDPILTINEAFLKDARSDKINLSIGIYFDDTGAIPILPSVLQAEKQVVASAGARPYLPMEGAANFRLAVQQLLFDEHAVLKDNRVATIQSIGSSGGLKVGADFLAQYFRNSRVYLSDPTWENHRAVFVGAGMVVESYPYYDKKTGGVAFDQMLSTLSRVEKKSVVVLHACCHNPTGVDLTKEQWHQLLGVLKERACIPFLDLAYQGYGDGLEEDLFAVRLLADSGLSFFVANSFSKNMSLYGERCGALNVICGSDSEVVNVWGQLKAIVRRNYSNPPRHGGQIVATVLTDQVLRPMWEKEVAGMRTRIQAMRRQLYDALKSRLPGQSFEYFLEQKGMFSYTGLTPEQCDRLKNEYGIYILRSGRMCIAGLNTRNIATVSEKLAAVLEG